MRWIISSLTFILLTFSCQKQEEPGMLLQVYMEKTNHKTFTINSVPFPIVADEFTTIQSAERDTAILLNALKDTIQTGIPLRGIDISKGLSKGLYFVKTDKIISTLLVE